MEQILDFQPPEPSNLWQTLTSLGLDIDFRKAMNTAACLYAPTPSGFISHKIFIKSFGKHLFPYKTINLSFIMTNEKEKLTDLCGN